MTDYSKMNDRDIDRLVLKVIYGVHADDKDIQGCWSRGGFKHTTNPTDAMPIIIENKISIVSTDSSWIALPLYFRSLSLLRRISSAKTNISPT